MFRSMAQGILLAGVLATTAGALAQPATWPSKPVRLIVAFPPGGLADVLARMLQAPLGEALGQPVIIENKGGAGGNVAAVELLRTGGDGHGFMVNVSTLESVNPIMFERMPVNPGKDFQHAALLANTQLFLVTRPTLPVTDVKSLVAYAKAHPGKLSYASAGNGTTPHMGGELFKQGAGIFATHIPYRGAAPAIQDLMAGQVDFGFMPGTMFQHVKAGKLKLLGVASRQRTPNYPGAPTLTEEGIAHVLVDTPFVIYAPAAMPAAHVERLNREVNRVLAQPSIKSKFAEFGADATPLTPAEVKAMVQSEVALFGPIVKSRGIKSE